MSPSILNPSPFTPENSLGRILITGGCGFIGSNLIASLLKENPDVKIRILDNLSVGTKDDLSEVCNFVKLNPSIHNPEFSTQVELIVGDILNQEDVNRSVKSADTIVHLAANTGVAPSVENPQIDMETNVIGTFNMLNAARENGVHKFIFASSGAPLGEVEPPIHEKIAPKPVSPYGASKLAGEGYCSAFYRTFGVKTIALRFGNVYGPRSKNKSSVVAKFIKQALNSETLEIYGDGSQTRDFIYIDDLCCAIILAISPLPLNPSILNPEPWGEVFQIATHKETTVNEVAEAIKILVEKETNNKVNVVYGSSRVGDVKRNYSDISKARKILGFEPQYDLTKGLKETFKYFISDNLAAL